MKTPKIVKEPPKAGELWSFEEPTNSGTFRYLLIVSCEETEFTSRFDPGRRVTEWQVAFIRDDYVNWCHFRDMEFWWRNFEKVQ